MLDDTQARATGSMPSGRRDDMAGTQDHTDTLIEVAGTKGMGLQGERGPPAGPPWSRWDSGLAAIPPGAGAAVYRLCSSPSGLRSLQPSRLAEHHERHAHFCRQFIEELRPHAPCTLWVSPWAAGWQRSSLPCAPLCEEPDTGGRRRYQATELGKSPRSSWSRRMSPETTFLRSRPGARLRGPGEPAHSPPEEQEVR